MFYDCNVRSVGAGNNHVVVLTSGTPGDTSAPEFDFNLPLPVAQKNDDESEYHTANNNNEESKDVEPAPVHINEMREEEPAAVDVAVEPIVDIAMPILTSTLQEAQSAGSKSSKKRSY